jgi:deoxyribodipyrimidine photo-lyase
MKHERSLVWFRRDLRLTDQAALCAALAASRQVYCVFVLDRDLLDPLLQRGLKADRRVEFILGCLAELNQELRHHGGRLRVVHGQAAQEIVALANALDVEAVYANRDYEPAAIARDGEVAAALQAQGRQLISFKDQVVFEQDEVLSQTGKSYSIFTPYKNAWLKKLLPGDGIPAADLPPLNAWLAEPNFANLAPETEEEPMPSVQSLGFAPTNLAELGIVAGMLGAEQLLEQFVSHMAQYHVERDFPAVRGTSMLSVHLRFGTISVRALARLALDAMRSGLGGEGARVWLSELVWRDFYHMILFHHPHVVEHAFRPEFEQLEWESGEQADALFAAWCTGQTGYPLVDAAMLQLNRTGFMHNRLRMVTASFLVKDLGLDWRRGERYFADRLNDYDLAANNGGWQWAASTGCDAQPWFRIFNPVTQSKRFDAEGEFIRRYLPQLARLPAKWIHAPWTAPPEVLREARLELGRNYPLPVVDHEQARQRTLARYQRRGGAEQALTSSLEGQD